MKLTITMECLGTFLWKEFQQTKKRKKEKIRRRSRRGKNIRKKRKKIVHKPSLGQRTKNFMNDERTTIYIHLHVSHSFHLMCVSMCMICFTYIYICAIFYLVSFILISIDLKFILYHITISVFRSLVIVVCVLFFTRVYS